MTTHDGTPKSANETFSKLVEAHRDRKNGKKGKVLENPTAEALDVIREFGGVIEHNPRDNQTTVWVPKQYCFEHEEYDDDYAYPYEGPPSQLAALFDDWDKFEYDEVYLEFLFPAPKPNAYPIGIVRFLRPKQSSITVVRVARFKIADAE